MSDKPKDLHGGLVKDPDASAGHREDGHRDSSRLQGRMALITGGDGGIGRAVAIILAREGADVAIAYLSEAQDVAETVRAIREFGCKALAIQGDLSDPDDCREVVERTASELGGLDILVNDVVAHWEQETPGEQADRTFRTNVDSLFWVTRAALPHMKVGSTIINTGPVVPFRGAPTPLDYSATRGAIYTFTRALAETLADHGVRVNCVAPGPGPAARPIDLAPAFAFFASADSQSCTGEIRAVSGMPATRQPAGRRAVGSTEGYVRIAPSRPGSGPGE